jgi:ubiquinone/menaquinone biosynthesis C-methylase UbiE
MSNQDNAFAGNVERFTGFADLYDKYRPEPPAVLAGVVTQWAQLGRPRLVVDLGSGTGLSSRYWAARAEQVIGIDPTADMRREAEAQTAAGNVSYREGLSHQTGLPDGCADIVSCSQALHWMEPQATFQEAARILRAGGVFVAYDYDWPPTTSSWQADAAYAACFAQVEALEKDPRLQTQTPVKRWGKEQHLSRMRASGCFRYAKEIVLHQEEQGNAERLVGLLLSQGSVMTLLKAGYSEDQLGISALRQMVQRELGDAPQTWYWSSRVRMGVV